MNCTVCGGPYGLIGGQQRHVRCEQIRKQKQELERILSKAVEWLMDDGPNRGPMPDLVRRLRDEINDEVNDEINDE